MKIILRLLVFVKKRWATLLLGFICITVSTVGGLVIPRLLGNGIDTAVTSGSRTTIVTLALILLGTTLLRSAGRFGDTYITQLVSQQASYDIRNTLYDHLHKLGFAYYDKAQTGQIMSRCTADIEAARTFLSAGILNLIQIFIIVFGVVGLLISLNWQLALLTLTFMPVIFWQTLYVSGKLRPIWAKVQQWIGVLGVTLQESLFGVRVVKAFTLQSREIGKFSSQAESLYGEQMAAARIQAVYTPVMTILVSLPTVIVLWFGGKQVIDGSLTIGGITQFILYLGMMAGFVSRLGQLAAMISRTISAGTRIFEILDTEPLIKDKPDAVELGRVNGNVEFKNVSFSYGTGTSVLSDITFNVEPGKMVALVGGSGSGKTTIINLISRFYDVTGGSITIDGHDIRDVTLASLRKNVVVTQQDIFLFSETIRDNIAYGAPDASREQIESAAKTAQIHDFIMSLPKGYDTWVGERGVTLSGGEKQRIAIARSLLVNPAVLILDDSTSSVDAETEHLILRAMNKLIEGRTTFVITHRLPIIRNAGLILVLKDGRIIEQGTHAALLAMNGQYREIVEGQSSAGQDKTPEGDTSDGER
ncbi:MAG: ABC transporter ATP-binding protein [Dehalococcoidales bacterium]|nr:ABC transporter ATP-binding protein [Dehalococcoidales bacterium]